MRFTITAAALVAMVSSALAQTADFNPIYKPGMDQVVPAGSSFEVTWDAPAKYLDGTVSIHLIGGANDATLVPISDIASGVKNSDKKYTWAVDGSLGADTIYGLVFKLESDPQIFQYSQPFKIEAGKGGDDKGGNTVTVTTNSGIKTVTLSSCTTSTTSTPIIITTSAAPNTTTTISYTTTSAHHNTTSAYTPPPTTSFVPAPEPTAPEPAPVPTTSIVTAGAAGFVAGPVALIGGLAVALLAL